MPRWRSADLRASSESATRRSRPSCGYLLSATDDKIFPKGGGMLIRADNGDVMGAVGVTGDTEDRDEELAIHGIRTVGLKTDEDCADMGRGVNVRQTK